MTRKPTLKARPAPGARTHVPDSAAEALERKLAARERGSVQASERPSVQTSGDSRIVARSGRLRADGTRTGARELRRSTVYLPPELARRLDVHAAEHGREKSAVVADALAAWLERKGGK